MTLARTVMLGLVFFIILTVGTEDKVTVMFPASLDLPNVSAFQIAKYKHYYADAGLNVEFLPGQGGVYAGKQVGAGKADFAEIFGDTAVVLRSQGLPVKMVAMMGGASPMVLAASDESGVKALQDLKGKSISILGREDSTYYILLAALATVNLTEKDVDIRALGPSGVIDDFISGKVQVCACIPEWVVKAEDAGVKMNVIRVADYLPTLGQSIVTSDQFLSARPDVARRFVQATIHAFSDLRDGPAESAKAYAEAVPVHRGQEAKLLRIYSYHNQFSWSRQKVAGAIDAPSVKSVQDAYYDRRVIAQKSPLESLFTNELVAGTAGADMSRPK